MRKPRAARLAAVRILFDQGVPLPLRRELPDVEIATAFRVGWSRLSNGDLLAAAETAGFGVLLTTDKNLRYQQNLVGRKISIVVLPTTEWAEIRKHVNEVRAAISAAKPGSLNEVTW